MATVAAGTRKHRRSGCLGTLIFSYSSAIVPLFGSGRSRRTGNAVRVFSHGQRVQEQSWEAKKSLFAVRGSTISRT